MTRFRPAYAAARARHRARYGISAGTPLSQDRRAHAAAGDRGPQALAMAAAAHPDLDLRELAAELVSQADLLGRMVDELDAAAAVARADAPLVVRDPQTGRG